MPVPAFTSRGSSGVPAPRLARPYYLDGRLSLAEGTRRYPTDGRGHAEPEEGFFVLAIRRNGFRECVFRFSEADRSAAYATVELLNQPREKATTD
jgi:hypothetical protein